MLLDHLRRIAWLATIATFVLSAGCTSFRDYVQNGLKVGPNYSTPPAPVAVHWIDAADRHVSSQPSDLSHWWTVFHDPVLDNLVQTASRQNLTLRQAALRVLEARAQYNIAVGKFFPQTQQNVGSYQHSRTSLNPPSSGPSGSRSVNEWNDSFRLAWELDFWGRLRRAIDAQEDSLEASVWGYDQVMVTLLGDIASNYLELRTDQERIQLLRENVELQRAVVDVTRTKVRAGAQGITALDMAQAESLFFQTQAQIPLLEADRRQANNRLCTLLGVPPVELREAVPLWRAEDQRKQRMLAGATGRLHGLLRTIDPAKPEQIREIESLWTVLGTTYIPATPAQVVVGIPADLLRRRPDVRQAERLAAAQGEQIGIAQADLYPAFTLNGTLGWQAQQLGQLFTPKAFTGSVGPSFQWNLLNYGRIVNNVRFQDATFQQLVVAYQQSVLQANEEVEDGLATFLTQQRAEDIHKSVQASQRAVVVARSVLEVGRAGFDYNRYAVIEQNLVQQQDSWAQARGSIAQGLIQVYRALGGGWEIAPPPEQFAECPPAIELSAPAPVPSGPPVEVLPPPAKP